MTRREVGNLYQALLTVGNLTGVKFSYAVARNLSMLKNEMTSLQKAGAMDDNFREYEEKRIALAEKCSIQENGKPKIVDDKYEIADQAAFDTELKAIQEEYKVAFEARKKQLQEFEELLKEEIEIDPFMITQDMIPESITSKQMADILPLIKE